MLLWECSGVRVAVVIVVAATIVVSRVLVVVIIVAVVVLKVVSRVLVGVVVGVSVSVIVIVKSSCLLYLSSGVPSAAGVADTRPSSKGAGKPANQGRITTGVLVALVAPPGAGKPAN